jgi:hypothetical protein
MPSNSVRLIKKKKGFEEELEKFKSSFERDEIMDTQNIEKKYEKFNFFFCNFIIFRH